MSDYQMIKMSVLRASALKRTVHFLSEKRTELYRAYYSGVSQLKNVLGAKNFLQSQALLDLGRSGA